MWSQKPESDDRISSEPLIGDRSSSELSDLEKNDMEQRLQPTTLPTKATRSLYPSMLIAFNVLLFIVSISLFFQLPRRSTLGLNYALKQFNPYTPVLDDIEVPIVSKQVHGELFPAKDPSYDYIGRREPSPELDKQWEDYEVQRMFVLNRSQVLAMGKDPAMTVKYPNEDFGLGDEAYMAGMDIFHVLHCFNAIRQAAFQDYYFDGVQYHRSGYSADNQPKRRHTEMYWLHLRHCTDIITQTLMCHADASMVTMTWLEEQSRPWPDFSVNKKCVDFEKLVQWRDEHAMDVQKAGSVLKPESVKGTDGEVKIADGYWRIFGNETVRGDRFHHPLWEVDGKGWPVREGEGDG